MSRVRSRAFTFTWNNYSDEDVEYVKQLDCSYVVFGKEKAKTGTPHLQGYVYFLNPREHKAICRLFKDKCHVECARGAPEQNFDYVTKEGDYFEKGTRPLSDKEKGKRGLERYTEARRAAEEGRFADIPDDLYIRHKRSFTEIYKEAKRPNVSTRIQELRPWQSALAAKLRLPPHARSVLWYTDLTGGQGKTEFARWAVNNLSAHVVNNAKTADIAYGLPDEPRIVIFDFTRSMEDHVNYGAVEAVKNGMIFSSKYESRMRFFPIPHVVIFANFEPDQTKLSADRWDITTL